MKSITTTGAILIFIATAVAEQSPEAKITLHVVNEQGVPMKDTDVMITFDVPKYKPGQWGSPDVLNRSGRTSTEGLFSVSAEAGNYVNYGAHAAGFYSSHGNREFMESKDHKWQPWNPTVDVVLKRIVNPIPMYARHVETEIPVIGSPVGFDLTEADWVAPYGRGIVSDLIFDLTKRVESFHDFDAQLSLTFSDSNNGIQEMPSDHGGSQFRSPYAAPETTYQGSLSLRQGNSKQTGQYGLQKNPHDYFFKIRSETNSKGEAVNALYGKIYGGIEYFPVSHKTAKIRFTYYLNPTPNDRNIEFDPKRNLFTNLKPEERVTEP